MKRRQYIGVVFALLFAIPSFAHQVSKPFIDILSTGKHPITVATKVEDSSKIIKNPGNCPIEFLRRIGRAFSKYWPENKTSFLTATIIFKEHIGKPDFIRNLPEENLSESQIEAANSLINSHSEKFKQSEADFNPPSEAISMRFVVDVSEIQKNLKELLEEKEPQNTDKKIPVIPLNEKDKIKEDILPVIEAFSDFYGLLSISEKGIFGRVNGYCEKGNLDQITSIKPLSLDEYIDEEPLIILAQTHSNQEPAMVMKKLESIPNMKVINQLVASAGLDFEKDLLVNNYALESILYVNLTPTGEKMIPDVRLVTMLPKMEHLVSIIPNLKKLCMNTGVFITNLESTIKDVDIVRLNHFLLSDYGIYISIIDKFCVISSTQEGHIKALSFLNTPSKRVKNEKVKDCNFYFRIKTSDLNIQLQQFLQSPLLRDKGIPPLTNMTFLKEMDDVVIKSKMNNKDIKIDLNIPFSIKEKDN